MWRGNFCAESLCTRKIVWPVSPLAKINHRTAEMVSQKNMAWRTKVRKSSARADQFAVFAKPTIFVLFESDRQVTNHHQTACRYTDSGLKGGSHVSYQASHVVSIRSGSSARKVSAGAIS